MFTIGGYQITIYGVLGAVGFILAILIAMKMSKHYSVSKEDILYCAIYAIIGVFIGAKLLYILTSLPYIIENLSLGIEIIDYLFKGGFVFYGGVIGGILGILVYSKQFKIELKPLLNLGVLTIPAIQAIGRIGCLAEGCCYGIPYDGIAHITYHNSLFAPNNINLFPVQLVESVFDAIIFIMLLLNFKKNKDNYKTVSLYCILYGIVRFILEFLRGDEVRGILLQISTSQYISIVAIIIGIILWNKKENKNEDKIKE